MKKLTIIIIIAMYLFNGMGISYALRPLSVKLSHSTIDISEQVTSRLIKRPIKADAAQDKTLLVVDDEMNIRTLFRAFLGGKYHVIVAADDKEALKFYEASPMSFDVAIIDIDLTPKQKDAGLLLADVLTEINPNQKVILMSAHSRVMKLAKEQGIPYIYKDGNLKNISTAVEAVLEESSGEPSIVKSTKVAQPREYKTPEEAASDIQQAMADAAASGKNYHGHALLFGKYARGEATIDSHLDIAIPRVHNPYQPNLSWEDFFDYLCFLRNILESKGYSLTEHGIDGFHEWGMEWMRALKEEDLFFQKEDEVFIITKDKYTKTHLMESSSSQAVDSTHIAPTSLKASSAGVVIKVKLDNRFRLSVRKCIREKFPKLPVITRGEKAPPSAYVIALPGGGMRVYPAEVFTNRVRQILPDESFLYSNNMWKLNIAGKFSNANFTSEAILSLSDRFCKQTWVKRPQEVYIYAGKNFNGKNFTGEYFDIWPVFAEPIDLDSKAAAYEADILREYLMRAYKGNGVNPISKDFNRSIMNGIAQAA